MRRREFLVAGLAVGGAAVGASRSCLSGDDVRGGRTGGVGGFRMNFAPHFGMFRHSAGCDEIDQIQFLSDLGFRAVEDGPLMLKSPQRQRQIGRELECRGMTLGAFTATSDFARPTFASGDEGIRRKILAEMREAVSTAQRVNGRWCIVVPGQFDRRLPPEVQTARAVETLKACAEICERAGLVMLLEPLNRGAGHPRLLLEDVPQAYALCKAVGSPSCKILFDIYQQQACGGNVLPSIDKVWSEIGYVQIGDSRGRKEPGTGEIDFVRVLRHLSDRRYAGILGLDHGNSRPGAEGERAVLAAYRKLEAAVVG